MFKNNTWFYLGKSNTVKVIAVSLSASPTSVSSGQTITVTFSGAPGNQKDFIALYKVGVPNGQPYVSYKLLNGQTSGTLYFTAPSTAGDYEFRMFKNNTWFYLGKSNTVVVESEGDAIWTVMAYLDGDDDTGVLDYFAWNDLSEMESVGPSNEIDIVAQVDVYSSSSDTYRYHISGADEGTSYPLYPDDIVETLPEQNMADPATLTSFVNWATENYPAENYLLVLWDHGNGWKAVDNIPRGLIYDDYDSDFMTMVELFEGLEGTNEKMDIIGFDACLMQMIEVAYELSKLTNVPNYMVGSEQSEPGDGWPFDDILAHLVANPHMSDITLCEYIVDDYINSCSTYGTLSVLDFSRLDSNTTQAIDSLANALSTSSYQDEISNAKSTAQSYDVSTYKDLYDFAQRIYSNVPDCLSEAQAVKDQVSNIVVYEDHIGIDETNSHGVSIYIPDDAGIYDHNYDSLQFAIDTQWDEYLQGLLEVIPIHNITQTRYYDTIQGAIDASTSGDEIAVSPGTYYENINFLGRNITLRSNDPNNSSVVASTIIDGGGSGSVVTFENGETVQAVLSGFTIQNGNALYGGGIYFDGSSATLNNNNITDNTANSCGGGIYMEIYCSPTITGNNIINNTAVESGGGIYFFHYCSPIISNNVIHNNTAPIGGGGIIACSHCSPTITGNTITGNTSRGDYADGEGGGIMIYADSSGVITGNTITGNLATYEGAGINVERNSSPTISDNIISDNTICADEVISRRYGGAGITVKESSYPTITGNTITENSIIGNSEEYNNIGGAGIDVTSGSPAITGNTICGNEVFAVATDTNQVVPNDYPGNDILAVCD